MAVISLSTICDDCAEQRAMPPATQLPDPVDGRNVFLPSGYAGRMAVRKLSISVPPEVEETIKAAAAEEGKPVSVWMAEAATEKAQAAAQHAAGRAAARELVAEYESEHGPLPAASRHRAREFLAEVGLLDDGSQQAAG